MNVDLKLPCNEQLFTFITSESFDIFNFVYEYNNLIVPNIFEFIPYLFNFSYN